MSLFGKIEEYDQSVERWSDYVDRVEQFFIANGIPAAEEERRRAVLLTVIGPETYGVLRALLSPVKPSEKRYADIIDCLKTHFEPGISPIVARYKFNNCSRAQGEAVSTFIKRLREASGPCEYGATLDEAIRDRLVCGVNNPAMTRRLLAESSLTLKSATDIVLSMESASSGVEVIGEGAAARTAQAVPETAQTESLCWVQGRPPGNRPSAVPRGDAAPPAGGRHVGRPPPRQPPFAHARPAHDGGGGGGAEPGRGPARDSGGGGAQWFTTRRRPPTCRRCGRQHQDSFQCRFLNLNCWNCGRRGHAERMCPRPATAVRTVEDTAAERPEYAADRPEYAAEPVGEGSRHTEDTEEVVYEMYNVASSTEKKQPHHPPIHVKVDLNGRSHTFELDTGASVSVCSERTYQRLWPSGERPPIEPFSGRLRTYSGENLRVVGKITVCAQYRADRVTLPLVVLCGDGPSLLGRDWLRHFRLDWPSLCVVKQATELDAILARHSAVFEEGLGCYRGGEVTITVKEGVRPRFFRARQVPLAYREEVNAELDRQIAAGLWEPVAFSEWAAPLVVVPRGHASEGKVRLCGDYRLTVNKASPVETYPLPRIEEVLSSLSGGAKYLSKMDVRCAYNQLLLSPESRKYLTVNTSRGLLVPRRLSFGYSSAVAIFQRTMESLLADIPGVVVFLDDIVVSGLDEESHNRSLERVLARLEEAGFRLNKGKCQFGVSELTYLGHRISARGVSPTSEKVRAVLLAPPPRNVKELKSWLGGMSYYSKFLRGLATLMKPLYALLKQGVRWTWGPDQVQAFTEGKRLLSSAPLLAHFDSNLPVVLSCDASPVGVGCVLSQIHQTGERPVAFYSRSLSDSETRFSQTDREGLAILTGVKHFHYWLAGRRFVIRTDHRPLLGLLGENKPLPIMASPRVMRWALLLSAYQYELCYVPGAQQGNCDALSRLPLPAAPATVPSPPETIRLLEFMDASPVTASDIRTATRRDPVLSAVLRYVLSGWPDAAYQLAADFAPYRARHSELSVHDGCLLWGGRLVVPGSERGKVLQLLHEGHFGESHMKSFSRMYVWWPGIDNDVVRVARTCRVCQALRGPAPPVPLSPWKWPERPWDRVHIDYFGPYEGRNCLILIDAHSKWIEVMPVTRTTAAVTIEHLRQLFATFGIPRYLVSDNAACFVCPEFKLFCDMNNITHLTSPPRSPKSNGLVERAVQTVKAGLQKQKGASFATRLSRFLFRYRSMPTRSTGVAPAELLLGRRPRTHWDSLMPDLAASVEKKQQAMAVTANLQRRSRHFVVGDRVYVTEISQLSGANGCRWLPGTVVAVEGFKVSVRLEDGRVVVRHADKVRPDLGDKEATPQFETGGVDPTMGLGVTGFGAHPIPAPGQTHVRLTTQMTPPEVSQSAAPYEETPPPTRTAASSPEPEVSVQRYNLRSRESLRAPVKWSL